MLMDGKDLAKDIKIKLKNELEKICFIVAFFAFMV